jgi:hypothetical protein
MVHEEEEVAAGLWAITLINNTKSKYTAAITHNRAI